MLFGAAIRRRPARPASLRHRPAESVSQNRPDEWLRAAPARHLAGERLTARKTV
jgi:hypothetical protein